MNNELYTKRRDELLMLLDETISIGLPKTHDADLREIYRKCQEDQFEIALVGEFQGGKSTTFNALCDGREISPRGLGGGGLKTSAAIVTAQHISDPHEQKEGLSEWAEVRWRSSVEIIIGFADLLKKHLAEDQEFQVLFNDTPEENRIDYATPSDLVASLLNLHNPQHRAALHRALEAEWNRWANDKRNYGDGNLDQLRIATLQLRFHDTEEWRELCSRTVFPIAEFQQMITFPRDWTKRFNDGINAPFEFKDAVFVFIADILVRLRAANLGRIGCRITDCPGLFVSDWDTQLARKAMKQSDVIWYLFNGGKQIGDSDKKMIKFIQDHGWIEKLRATLNLRNNTHENIIETILPEDESILGSMGLEDLVLHPYDARLAFLACQGDLLLTNPAAFGEWDRQCMAYDNDKMPVENLEPPKAWQRFIRQKASVSGLAALEDVNRLDVDTVQKVKGYSYLDGILNNLENLVIEKKAESILVHNGSRPTTDALEKLEGDLRAKEETAVLDANQFEQRVNEAQGILDTFIKDEKELLEISKLNNSFLDMPLAEDLTKNVIEEGFAIFVSREASGQIVEFMRGQADNRKEARKKQTDECINIFYKVFTNVLKASLTRELERISQGKNIIFKKEISDPFNKIAAMIAKKWEKESNDYSLLMGFTTPRFEEVGLDKIINAIFEKDINLGAIEEQIRDKYPTPNFIMRIFKNVSEILKKVYGPFKDILRIFMVDINELIFDPDGTIEAAKKYEREKNEEKKNEDKAKQEIYIELCKTIGRDIVNNESVLSSFANEFASTFIYPLRSHHYNYIANKLTRMKTDFESRTKERQADFNKSNAYRAKVAEESRRIRTQKIAPARQRINDFEAKVLKDLGKVALS